MRKPLLLILFVCFALFRAQATCSNPPQVILVSHSGTVCNMDSQIISGTFSGSATMVTVTTSGSGTFNATTSNISSFSFTYYPGATDDTTRSVLIIVTTDNPLGAPCVSASDTFILKPLAGPNQIICQNGFVTMAATGTGTWTELPTNPRNAIIISPSSATSNITGFTAGGNYGFIWTSGGCSDTMTVYVNALPNAGPNQTDCGGNPVTMAASGTTGIWTAYPSNPHATVFSNDSSSTSTVNGFTLAGTYSFVWAVNGCNSGTMNVVVTAKPNAGADQSVCQNSSAITGASGSGAWSALPTNPSTAIITFPTSPATSITALDSLGTYGFVWTVSGCTDTMEVTVHGKPNAGPDQIVCQHGTATLAAIGSGTWTALPTNPANTTFGNASSPTTTVTGFSTGGTYGYVWTVSGCADTMDVVVQGAGPNQNVCGLGDTITMAAMGTGTWTILPGNPSLTTVLTPSSATSKVVGFTVHGTYSYSWTVGGCVDTMHITYGAKPNAGPDQTIICFQLGVASMAAFDSTGLWTPMAGNPGTSTIVNPTSPLTSITGFAVGGTYSYVWNVNGCTDTARVIVGTQCSCPEVSAGNDQILSCGTACTNITANFFNTGQTTTYGVAPIPYTPFSYSAGTPVLVHIDDWWSQVIPLPFNFCFFGTDFNQFIVSSNGVVSFNTGNANSGNTWSQSGPLPGAAPADIANAIMLPWQDIDPTNRGTISYQILGSYPCRYFVVSFDSVPYYADPNSVCSGCDTSVPLWCTSQCVLYETTNYIDIYIKSKADLAHWNNGAAVEGIINGPRTVAYTVPGRNYVRWTAFDDAYRFTPNGPSTVTLDWFQPPNPTPIDTTLTAHVCPPSSADSSMRTMYVAQATYHRCDLTTVVVSDTMYVTTTPVPVGGPNQAITCFTGMDTATMAADSSKPGVWIAVSTNPSPTIIAQPDSPHTIITGFADTGTYRYLWGNSPTCVDTVLVTVYHNVNAGPDQMVCQFTQATMAAVGSGTWTPFPTNPPGAVITNPVSALSTITNLDSVGTYSFVWTTGPGCSDTMNIFVPLKPNAGPDVTICQFTAATLAAIDTGTWSALSANPSVTIIATPTSPGTGVTGFDSSGAYGYVWTAGGCTDTMMVHVTPKPNAGADQTICQYTNTVMAATDTGVWTAFVTNPAGSTITNPSSPTTGITGGTLSGTYSYVWTANGCTDTMNINVTPKPDAGPDQTICQFTGATMAGSGLSGLWTAIATNPAVTTITNPSSPAATIAGFTASGAYSFVWTVNGCTDTTIVNVTAKPNAGLDQTICQYTSAVMAATGIGAWTALGTNPAGATITNPSSPATGITGNSLSGTYGYVWTSNGCTDTMNINVTAKPNAGPDQTICEFTGATMAGSGATGLWTAIATNPATTTITNPTASGASITGFTAAGPYSFVWTVNGCTDTMVVNVTAKPDAGLDQTICEFTSATMAATGAGVWSALSTNPAVAAISNPSSAITTITGFTPSGVYGFVWTVNGCTDTMNVNVTAKPDAGPDMVICQYTNAVMAGNGVTGLWTAFATNPVSTVITNPSSPSTTISGFTTVGIYTYVWTVSGCTDTMNVTVSAQPNGGPTQTICEYTSATMAGTGAGVWSAVSNNPAVATIVNPSSANTVITDFTAGGAYGFIWTVNGCPDTISVNVTPKPDAGPDQTICQFTDATMAGSGVTGLWTAFGSNPVATPITNPSSPSTTITGYTVPGIYTYVWTTSGCTDTMNVTVTAKPNAGADQNICQYSTATMAGIGSGIWSGLPTNPTVATITNTALANTTIANFTTAGVYGFVWTVNGCTDTMNVTVSTQPVVSVSDTGICIGMSATLAPAVSPAGGTYLWSTSSTAASITVTPIVTTIYSLTYTVGICATPVSDTVTVYSLPVAAVTTINSICTANNGKAIANVSSGTPAYTYLWSGGQTSDTAVNFAPGLYSVSVTDAHGCTATASGTVGLVTPTITIDLVSIHNLKCFDDASGKIIIDPLDSGTLTYVWSGTLQIKDTITNLQIGTYDVTVTDQFGCTGSATYTITQPPAPLMVSAIFTDPVCHGYANGNATVTATGGTPGYQYTWNTAPTPQTTPEATGLIAGTYIVTVADDSNCLAEDTVTLTDPLAITFGDSIIVEPSCYLGSNGTAQVVPMNGIGSYTYLWAAPVNQTTNPATGLAAGTYTVTATDTKGCTGTESVPVDQPTPDSVSIAPVNVTCFGYNNGSAIATASGGTPVYTYAWSNHDNTASVSGLAPGPYSVTSTDSKGCTASDSVNITQPTIVSESLTSTRTNCSGSLDGTVTTTGAGGTGSLVYSIYPGTGSIALQTNDTGAFSGLGSGLYTVVTTDSNGCTARDTITVPSAPFNTYSSSADTVSCYGSQYQDGIIHVHGFTIVNGPFQYSVDNGPLQYTDDFFDLGAGPHTIKAVDSYGCDTTFTVTVGEPLPATVQILPGDSTLEAGETLQLSTVFSPYSINTITGYSWSPGVGLSCIDCPSPIASPYSSQTVYSLTVTYNKGCVAMATIQININGQPPIYIPNAFTPNGDGINDVFMVYGTGIESLKLMIFDRWGEKVYESDNQSDGWDGTYRSQPSPTGVYVYLLDVIYLNGQKLSRNGSITLIR